MQALLEALTPVDPEWPLAKSIDPDRLPAHIAIIMDGNGRWASERNMPRVAGHQAGVDPVRSTVETCARLGIRALTLYAFSVENWKRPRHEIETLWRLLRYYLRREIPKLMTNNIRLFAIGRLDGLPRQVREELEAGASVTGRNTGLCVNLAINYGGRAEIVDAVNALLKRAHAGEHVHGIDEAVFASHLSTAHVPDPDLLIRTSGEMRVSNFLLWQIAYAELYVTRTLWPDFDRIELLRAIIDFQRRDRRFGGLRPRAESNGEAPVPESLVPAR